MKRYIVILTMCFFFTMPAFFTAHAQKIVQAQGTASVQKDLQGIERLQMPRGLLLSKQLA
ncbi:MAG: hypothetical protein JRF08_08315 [Deltaproteobacteria bacterium]|nr:hypothetical protein [Deltaproteobacteria bacterium]